MNKTIPVIFALALLPGLVSYAVADDSQWINEVRCEEVLAHDRKNFLKPVRKLMEKWINDINSEVLYEAALDHCLHNPRDSFDIAVRRTYCNELENMTEGWRDFCRANIL